jgi:anti-sigma regulatory factor (Ser/Thr protein kinase)
LARQFAAAVMQGLPLNDVDDALLVVSELVTNALVHGSGPRWIAVDPGDGRIRVSVADHSHRPPLSAIERPPRAIGLRMVDRLSDEWGVDFDDAGKVMWSVLDRR